MIHQILSYAVFSFCYFPAKIEVGKWGSVSTFASPLFLRALSNNSVHGFLVFCKWKGCQDFGNQLQLHISAIRNASAASHKVFSTWGHNSWPEPQTTLEAPKLSLQPTDCLFAQIYPISRNWRKSCGDYYLRLHNNNSFEVHVLLGPAKPKLNTTRNKCSHKAYEHHSQSMKTMTYGSDKLPWLPHWLHPLPTVSWV
jgi:hypothetical protein